eukprot:7416635-Pyramimonas_sp.AAC.1
MNRRKGLKLPLADPVIDAASIVGPDGPPITFPFQQLLSPQGINPVKRTAVEKEGKVIAIHCARAFLLLVWRWQVSPQGLAIIAATLIKRRK